VANQIVVLEQGLLVERGTHAELMALDGLYAEIWCRQASDRFSPEACP
jgi:ATP-binding cassette subfamily B protein